jgi:hypothetical protein
MVSLSRLVKSNAFGQHSTQINISKSMRSQCGMMITGAAWYASVAVRPG